MSSTDNGKRVASPASDSGFSGRLRAGSVRSSKHQQPQQQQQQQQGSAHRKIVTSPPWAQHEPPSPDGTTTNLHAFLAVDPHPSESRPRAGSSTHSRPTNSDVASLTSSNGADASHWWTFNLPLPIPLPLRKNSNPPGQGGTLPNPASSGDPGTSGGNSALFMREKPRTQWLFDRVQVRKDDVSDDEANVAEGSAHSSRPSVNRQLHLQMPKPDRGPYTVAQTKTPGWETPWAPATPVRAFMRTRSMHSSRQEPDDNAAVGDGDIVLKPKTKRRQRQKQTLREWVLHSNLVPLIIRVLNLSFTVAALAVAISIRQMEKRHHLVGAVGSSPILVIIFAPLTLVHVIVAIYLEYFGKPLGLWRTSGKLLHTLLEMLFVCMWSASVSLCFDNFFTSPLQCAPQSSTHWWNEITREVIQGQGRGEGGPADHLCDAQVALICLVFFGLSLYCSNLIISLFRIFEKVKYHGPGTSAHHV